MSRLTESTDVTQVKPEEIGTHLDRFSQQVSEILNGGIDFRTNFNGGLVNAVFIAANTDTAVAHNLGRIPTGYIPTAKTAAMHVYTGTAPWTTKLMYLKSDVIGTVGLLVY